MTRLAAFIGSRFPRSELLERFSDRVIYAMPTTSISSPADVFRPLEESKSSPLDECYVTLVLLLVPTFLISHGVGILGESEI